jgi:hypothetical protein
MTKVAHPDNISSSPHHTQTTSAGVEAVSMRRKPAKRYRGRICLASFLAARCLMLPLLSVFAVVLFGACGLVVCFRTRTLRQLILTVAVRCSMQKTSQVPCLQFHVAQTFSVKTRDCLLHDVILGLGGCIVQAMVEKDEKGVGGESGPGRTHGPTHLSFMLICQSTFGVNVRY